MQLAPVHASSLDNIEGDYPVSFSTLIDEQNFPPRLSEDVLSDPSELAEDNSLRPESDPKLEIIVDAETEYIVSEGTVIDERFIKEKIINQILISNNLIAKDQIEIVITNQFFSSDYEQEISYSVFGKYRQSLLSNEIDYSIQLNLKVTFEEAKLTAKPSTVTTVLGTKDDEQDLYSFVQEVKLGDQYLTEDQYTVQLQDTIATDVTGQKKVTVQVLLNADPSKQTTVETTVNVRWGKSIAISGEWTGTDARRIVSALTLHPGPSISLESGQGASSLDYSSLPTFNNPFFSTVSFYQADESGILNLSLTPNQQFSLKSKDTPKQIKELWVSEIGERVKVEMGDIIQIWHGRKTGEKYERPWLYLIDNETFFDNTNGLNEVYYEITDEGFKQVQLNSFTTNELTVPIYTNNAYFNDHIDEFINVEGLLNISKEFLVYPDTTSSGEKEAVIRVEQTMSSGKKIQYDYVINVYVEEGELNLSVPQFITFSDFTLQSEKQLVGRNNGALELAIQDSRGAGLQGNYTLNLGMDDNSLLGQYLVYKDSANGQEQFLNHSSIQIFTSSLEENPDSPSENTPLHTWDTERGLFLSIPADEPLKAQTYTGTLKWTLTAGPS
ncbi:hypothetical protein C240_1261 [Enterococcus sp. 5H]|nr:hypothetical protein [Enterococcus sp. 5H]